MTYFFLSRRCTLLVFAIDSLEIIKVELNVFHQLLFIHKVFAGPLLRDLIFFEFTNRYGALLSLDLFLILLLVVTYHKILISLLRDLLFNLGSLLYLDIEALLKVTFAFRGIARIVVPLRELLIFLRTMILW